MCVKSCMVVDGEGAHLEREEEQHRKHLLLVCVYEKGPSREAVQQEKTDEQRLKAYVCEGWETLQMANLAKQNVTRQSMRHYHVQERQRGSSKK